MLAAIKSIYRYFKKPTGFLPIMNHVEAVKILELRNRGDLYKRYKHLIKINHPDVGGSPYLASKINEAKAFLESNR